AARAIARLGHPTLLVGAPSAADAGDPAPLLRAPRLPLAELGELIRAAQLVISNGGDTLLQVLACARACVAVPIARDQAHRIACCVQAGLAVRAELHPRSIETVALALLQSPARRADLEARAGRHRVRNCLEEVLGALTALIS
ncbi:MAG: hypothetical protein ACRETS_08510, partial [Steroidobacteraceae bacterium]